MLSLPQNQNNEPKPDIKGKSPDVIFMEEDGETIEFLLRMVCGMPIVPVDNYDVIDTLLFAAEKYDMPGPMSILRLLVMTPPLLNQPFRLYTVACRYGWETEAKFASTQTLTYNLHDPSLRPLLQRLSTDALLNLLELHRSRREGLRQRLNEPPFVPGTTATCINCRGTIDYHTWRELKYKITLEMDVRPLGDTVIDQGLAEWPEAKACWVAKCPNPTCGRVLYDREPSIRIVKECIEDLRKTI